MIKIERLTEISENDLNSLLFRFGDDFSKIMSETVAPIVKNVKNNGDKAVLDYTEKFDNVRPKTLLATKEEIEEASKKADKDVLSAFAKAAKNVRAFHEAQKRNDIEQKTNDGSRLGIMYQPVQSAAMYVPGGKASYPSSVMMGVIPAQVAGVENIMLITPPDANGTVTPMTAAICRMLGVDRIIKSGGAQGIAAAGFGTETVQKADIIVGPGNIFVTAAKSYLFSLGVIQIDSLAGPSEVLIIADQNANAKWVAWDMLSQAEHEENAIAILVTDSMQLAQDVVRELEADINSNCGRSEIKRKAIGNNARIFIVDTIDDAIEFSNSYGPEHMEMMVSEPLSYLNQVRNVGSLFLGDYAPVAVGDYYSGTNHVLPTGGAARFSSGLSVETFLRRTTYQFLTEHFLAEACEPIIKMSQAEGFADKHGGSVKIRFER